MALALGRLRACPVPRVASFGSCGFIRASAPNPFPSRAFKSVASSKVGGVCRSHVPGPAATEAVTPSRRVASADFLRRPHFVTDGSVSVTRIHHRGFGQGSRRQAPSVFKSRRDGSRHPVARVTPGASHAIVLALACRSWLGQFPGVAVPRQNHHVLSRSPNPALNLAPFGRWTLRDEAAQRRSPPR